MTSLSRTSKSVTKNEKKHKARKIATSDIATETRVRERLLLRDSACCQLRVENAPDRTSLIIEKEAAAKVLGAKLFFLNN
jgi:hypothetical protein